MSFFYSILQDAEISCETSKVLKREIPFLLEISIKHNIGQRVLTVCLQAATNTLLLNVPGRKQGIPNLDSFKEMVFVRHLIAHFFLSPFAGVFLQIIWKSLNKYIYRLHLCYLKNTRTCFLSSLFQNVWPSLLGWLPLHLCTPAAASFSP